MTKVLKSFTFIWLWLLIASIWPAIIWAQTGTLTGQVTNLKGEPLVGVNVTIKQPFRGTTTNLNGEYTIGNLLPGEYEYVVEASYLGYSTFEGTTTVREDETTEENCTLKESATLIDEEVEVGTRIQGRSKTETTLPVDVISAKAITSAPQVDLSQILHYLAPSFNANRQVLADGTDHIDPATLRGLGPDQVLVLVNGKRRHSSSLVNVNGTVGRGAVGTDFNTIPTAAIKQIEILRDGAAAQYGSDAIAGVINIVLKDNVDATSMSGSAGSTLDGGGEQFKYDASFGLKVGDKGYVNITGEMLFRNSANRGGVYTGNVYSANDSMDALLLNQLSFDRANAMKVGPAKAFVSTLFFNAILPLQDETELYGFGGVTYHRGRGFGFYRLPKDRDRVVLELHPRGFLPSIEPIIADQSLTLGIRKLVKGWNLDLSTTYGKNTFDFNVFNSNNASMGIISPINLYAGGFVFNQNTTGINLSKIFKPKGIKFINLSFGSEFRLDSYSIIAGEEASYINGGDTLSDGSLRAVGVQMFPGVEPENELTRTRYNLAFYADIESELRKGWVMGVAGRFESYSDFGESYSGKIATRLQVLPKLAIRGAVNSGFRAPSLHQIYSSKVNVQFIEGEPVRVGTFNNESQVTKAFGVGRLKNERSLNYSLGIASRLAHNLSLTADVYQIDIDDRIVISGLLDSREDEEVAKILTPFGVTSAQFFTNAIDTRTRGADVVLSYKSLLGRGILKLTAAGNYSKTEVIGNIRTTRQLEGKEDILFNREERSRIESVQPRTKMQFTTDYELGKFSALLHLVRFGEISYIHPDDGDPENWQLNTFTNRIESRDQVFSPKIVTDATISYQLFKELKFSIGGNNIFNVYPDKLKHSVNTSEGRFVYSRRVTQFGHVGAFYYIRANLKF